uniref:peptidyl-tRNA hydrolase n=1 Tax=Mantoniella antarctica TaxID=81844 RepID=A0A7S0SKI2_9CHLO|mmetsp:Transcript_26641/g.66740  ORF Transcript_26641/g.66740 Transcript_26641/m.66740 type:complete len:228 (+) Transcript_26641:262-945(+)|eukprot:CAMPEP_0181394590 /NCGR_PEP_ID=MMETSP1106-20121128/27860_1 /TAXON_ID=81844 /ORGANISM="Mantoniella antarctica, Strain SL-175" /LENGTH=227 /DNA_ID=CAMNT_0023516099 /DNA_START=188 /DNA_END=871 /DNA_ORIENTATION=-
MGIWTLVRAVVGFPMRLIRRRGRGAEPPVAADPRRWLVVGLGNPGKRFVGTRHNAGFEVLDRLAAAEGIAMGGGGTRLGAKLGDGTIAGIPVVLAKPQLFMNLSGESVDAIMQHYQILKSQILVVYDDLDTAVTSLKLKGKGGHGGHNGIRNIIDEVTGGDKSFARLKVGIGRPPPDVQIYDHVLTKFSEEERVALEETTYQEACDAVRSVLALGMDKAMTAVNNKK